jgi:hypothetical protein
MAAESYPQAHHPGQSQADRAPAALDPGNVQVDARTPAERLAEARRLAARLRFYADDPAQARGDWQASFPADAAQRLAAADGDLAPHLGLFGAFLDMLAPAQESLNQLSARHLDFHYHQVLGFRPRAALPERAHLYLEAKKGAPTFAITPAMRFSAGKDAVGAERLYAPTHEMLVGQARLTALHSIHASDSGVRFAALADSADGFGQPVDPASPAWMPFGHAGLPLAPLGFAFASSLLRLSEGERHVSLGLALAFLAESGLSAGVVGESLDAYVSGEQGWLGPYPVSGSMSDGLLGLTFTVPAGDPAVVDARPEIHGAAYVGQLPVVQFMLRAEAAARHARLAALRPDGVQLDVAVTGKRDLLLENDYGALNPRRAFQPFGPQPAVGSRFQIGCPEALGKPLTTLSIRLAWLGAPDDFAGWYSGYERARELASGVRGQLVYAYGGGNESVCEVNLMQREAGVTTLSPDTPATRLVASDLAALSHALYAGGSVFARLLGKRLHRTRPAAAGREPLPPPATRPGFITLALVDDFLHADYRRETLAAPSVARNEPYTPTVRDISLSYRARLPLVDYTGEQAAAFAAAADLQFFHVGPFGARREHPFLRRNLAWVGGKRPGLLPEHADEGEFIIGVSGIGAGDSIHCLLQVAEDSADPDLPAQPVRWSVLCDNHWREVAAAELVSDGSAGLRRSGVVGIVLGRDTTTDNSWLPAGPVWLRASMARYSAAACRLLAVHVNAVEVLRVWPDGSQPAVETLMPGSIAKLLAPPPGLKKLVQPYASFGGRAGESAGQLRSRAAERLRHRQRCVTAWDYERLLLEAFPELHRIKCLAHASDGNWQAPGQLLLLAIPAADSSNGAQPPRLSLELLTRMRELAQAHAAPGITVHVRNPLHQPVRLAFNVRFRAGHGFAYTRQQLHAAIVAHLSPWSAGEGGRPEFGGRIYRSALIDFVEALPYVDYVRDFRCGLAGSGDLLVNDVAEIVADRPDAILISAARHVIGEAVE